MKKESKGNKFVLPVKRYIIYLFVASLLVTGAGFSKYVTSGGFNDGARVAKFGELAIYETDKNNTKVDGQVLIYTPGVPIEKNPAVDFVGSEVSSYIYVEVSADRWTFNGVDTYTMSRDDSTVLLSWKIDTAKWTYLTTDSGSQIFYREYEAGTTNLSGINIIKDNNITVSDVITKTEMETYRASINLLEFKAYAVQLDGSMNALAEWNEVNSK